MLSLVAWLFALGCFDGTRRGLFGRAAIVAAVVESIFVRCVGVDCVPVFDVGKKVCRGLTVYAWQ